VTRHCADCGHLATTPYCTNCGAGENVYPPDVELSPLLVELQRPLNWGAAIGAGFWTFAMGAPVLGVLFWLSLPILPPVSIGIMAYLLFNGNRVALQRRRFATPDDFRHVQRAWGRAMVFTGIGTLAVVVIDAAIINALIEAVREAAASS
jgi:hypothetical protein